MEKILADILQELKWQTRILEKIVEAQAVKGTNHIATMKPLMDHLERIAGALPKDHEGANTLREMLREMKERAV